MISIMTTGAGSSTTSRSVADPRGPEFHDVEAILLYRSTSSVLDNERIPLATLTRSIVITFIISASFRHFVISSFHHSIIPSFHHFPSFPLFSLGWILCGIPEPRMR
jgi:hypothetical protein